MKTITFYSFKGGVGRSLTLSNMALWLADEMKAKVCVIDFDLEAPGLPYKFEDLQNPADQERLNRTEGIVEYIDEFKQTGIPPADFTRFYLPFTTKRGTLSALSRREIFNKAIIGVSCLKLTGKNCLSTTPPWATAKDSYCWKTSKAALKMS